jgi:hypothetical protein
MFTNSIKRLSESLAQAQEQSRQQRLRAQQKPTESKPLFDADTETASAHGGDSQTSEDPKEKYSEEQKTTSSSADAKDTSLPKEVRIKLAKLAKYEDRHPSNFLANV